MNILSRKYIDNPTDFVEWLEDQNFTVEQLPHSYRFKYNLDETETWYDTVSNWWWSGDYLYAVELYNNGILISKGLKSQDMLYVAIAPENEGDSWICQVGYNNTNRTGGDLCVLKSIPNSELQLSHDSIKLEQYYHPQTEEMTLNKYYMNIIPYRTLNWVYQSGYNYYPISSHIKNFLHEYDVLNEQIIEVTINEKKFILIIQEKVGYIDPSMDAPTPKGSIASLALRIP